MHAMRTAEPTRLIRPLILFVLTALLLALAGPTLAAEAAASAGNGKSWGAFFGRLHVVVLHLPIGLLVGAFVIELFGLFRRSKGYDVAAAWLFVLGFLSSIVAVVSGLLLAVDEIGNPDLNFINVLWAQDAGGVSETLGWHMWLGVTLMLAAGVAAVLKVMAVKKQWPDEVAVPDHGGWGLVFARLALIAAMMMLPFAGHLGGNMVHGEWYVFEKAPFPVPEKAVYWPNDPPVKPVVTDDGKELVMGSVDYWNVKIQPVLNKSCTGCHDVKKQNGDLRLDTLEFAMKGGASHELGLGTRNIIPGDPRYSEMFIRVTLPHANDEHMPTNKTRYPVLTAEQVAMIGDWIQAFDGKLDAPAKTGTTNQQATKPGGNTGNTTKTPDPAKPLIDPAAIRAIEDAGGSAQSLSQEENPDLLTIKFAYRSTLNPEAVAKIGNAAGQVAELDFQGSAFSDTAAQQLPAMARLYLLNLKDTPITDAGLAALPELPKLEWLNLFGTEITDAGLDSLKRYPTLKKLYVTGTGVTKEGVEKLKAALAKAQGLDTTTTDVISDFDAEFQFKDLSAEPEKPDQSTTGDKPVNTVCPVKGTPIDATQFVIYKDKKIAFCCGNCKAAFEKDPEKFAGKLPN